MLGGFLKTFNDGGRWQSVRIGRLRHDSSAAVLSDRAGSPPFRTVLIQPVAGTDVVYMVGVKQSDQNVDVEQSAHLQYGPSSRSRLTSSSVTIWPRLANGRSPSTGVLLSASAA